MTDEKKPETEPEGTPEKQHDYVRPAGRKEMTVPPRRWNRPTRRATSRSRLGPARQLLIGTPAEWFLSCHPAQFC